MIGVLLKEETNKLRHMGTHHVVTEAEVGVMPLQAQEELQGVRKSSLEPSEEEWPC